MTVTVTETAPDTTVTVLSKYTDFKIEDASHYLSDRVTKPENGREASSSRVLIRRPDSITVEMRSERVWCVEAGVRSKHQPSFYRVKYDVEPVYASVEYVTAAYTIKRHPNGNVSFTGWGRSGMNKGNKFFALSDVLYQLAWLVEDSGPTAHAVKDFGINSIADIFPVFKNMPGASKVRGTYGTIDANLYRVFQACAEVAAYVQRNASTRRLDVMRTDDPRKFIALIAGEYRKDILRTFSTLTLDQFTLALHSVRYVPVHWVSEFLEKRVKGNTATPIYGLAHIHKGWKNGALSDAQFRSALMGELDAAYLSEALSLADGWIEPRDVRRVIKESNTMQEAWNKVRKMRAAVLNERMRSAYDYPEQFVSLNGKKVGKYVIRLAKDGSEVKSWGEMMGTCIGGYAEQAYSYNTILGGIYDKNGTLKANFSFIADDGKMVLSQIYAKGNCPFADAQTFRDLFIAEGYTKEYQHTGGI